MDLSIVVPVFNEDESLPELMAWIDRVALAQNWAYEVVFIDDGSTDKSWSVIEDLSKIYDNKVRGIRFRRNYGKSAALQVGFEQVQGEVVVTMDADLQDSPDELPELVRMIVEDGFDLVSGWKKKRHDPISKTAPSKLFNAVARRMSGIELHDFNCGLKSYRKEVVKTVDIYGDMHRWIPVLAKWAGYNRIGEKVVQHRARQYGYSKFGWTRMITGFLDLLSVYFVGKFGKKPMHFFGTLGVIAILLGGVVLLWLTISKLFFNEWGIADRPAFFYGMILLLVGSQLFLTGFLAELLVRHTAPKSVYQIRAEI
jgi:glycosyltransferase involved in cell wall biosynthesis